MPTQLERAGCPASTLIVWLPGAGSTIDEFTRERFVEVLRERRIAADTLLADAHLGYYRNRSIVDRLEADVFAPARAAGYKQVWLAGISLGGLGTLLHESKVPGEVAGMVAIAPFLGEAPELDAIEAAGGLARWTPPPVTEGEPVGTELWRWLKGYLAPGANRPPLYLAYATEDRLSQGHRLLAANLPPQRVVTTQGGHDWPEWRRLWGQLLDKLPLPKC